MCNISICGVITLNPIEKFKSSILHLNRDWNHWSPIQLQCISSYTILANPELKPHAPNTCTYQLVPGSSINGTMNRPWITLYSVRWTLNMEKGYDIHKRLDRGTSNTPIITPQFHFSDSKLYSGVELRPWTFQWDLTLYLLIWTVSHINRSVHQWFSSEPVACWKKYVTR